MPRIKKPQPESAPRPRGSGSIKERAGRGWYAQVSRRENGRRYKRQSKYFPTKAEAQLALDKLMTEETKALRTRETVGGIVAAFILIGGKEPRQATTIQRYNGLVKNIATIADLQADRLKADNLNGLFQLLRKEGLAPTTIFHVHSLLFASFKWAKLENLIGTNPYDVYPIKKPTRKKSEATSLTTPDARKFIVTLETAKRYSGNDEVPLTRYGPALLFCLGTGMRRGEVCGLRKSSIDYERKVIHVRESRYQIVGETGSKSTKTGQSRELPLTSLALDVLVAEGERQAKLHEAAGDAWEESDYVFTDDFGLALAPLALTNAFRVVAKAAGFYDGPIRYSLHSLRHTAATWMLAAGMEIHAVSKILGHTQTSTTMNTYGHVMDGRQRIAADGLSDTLQKLRKVS